MTSRGRRYFQRRQAATGVTASPHGDMVGRGALDSNANRDFLQKSKEPAPRRRGQLRRGRRLLEAARNVSTCGPCTFPYLSLYLRWGRRSIHSRDGAAWRDYLRQRRAARGRSPIVASASSLPERQPGWLSSLGTRSTKRGSRLTKVRRLTTCGALGTDAPRVDRRDDEALSRPECGDDWR